MPRCSRQGSSIQVCNLARSNWTNGAPGGRDHWTGLCPNWTSGVHCRWDEPTGQNYEGHQITGLNPLRVQSDDNFHDSTQTPNSVQIDKHHRTEKTRNDFNISIYLFCGEVLQSSLDDSIFSSGSIWPKLDCIKVIFSPILFSKYTRNINMCIALQIVIDFRYYNWYYIGSLFYDFNMVPSTIIYMRSRI